MGAPGLLPLTLWQGKGLGKGGVAAAHEQSGFCLQSSRARGDGTHLGGEGAWEVAMGWPIRQKALNGEPEGRR